MEKIIIREIFQFSIRTMLKNYGVYPIDCYKCDRHIVDVGIINVLIMQRNMNASAEVLLSGQSYLCPSCGEEYIIPKIYNDIKHARTSAQVLKSEKNIIQNFSEMKTCDFHHVYSGIVQENELYQHDYDALISFFEEHQEHLEYLHA